MSHEDYQNLKKVKAVKWRARQQRNKETAKKGFDGQLLDFVSSREAKVIQTIEDDRRERIEKMHGTIIDCAACGVGWDFNSIFRCPTCERYFCVLCNEEHEKKCQEDKH